MDVCPIHTRTAIKGKITMKEKKLFKIISKLNDFFIKEKITKTRDDFVLNAISIDYDIALIIITIRYNMRGEDNADNWKKYEFYISTDLSKEKVNTLVGFCMGTFEAAEE